MEKRALLRLRIRRAALATFMLILPSLGAAEAQAPISETYPAKAIRWFLPGPPGSPPDLVTRIVSERLAAMLAQRIIVENRPGAGGTLALSAVARATPDGYTLGLMGINHVVAPGLIQQMPYDTAKDLTPVTQLVYTANILAVRSSSPLKSVADLVSVAKANPGRIACSSAGIATPSHLVAVLFMRHAGVKIHHVPYKGPAAAITAVIGEQVDLTFVGAATLAPYLTSGRVRGLATPAPARLAAFPDIPTMIELGYAGLEIRDWLGVVVPSGTPKEVIARLAREIASIVELTEVKERFASLGMETADRLGPGAFEGLIRSELARWPKVVREAGIRAE